MADPVRGWRASDLEVSNRLGATLRVTAFVGQMQRQVSQAPAFDLLEQESLAVPNGGGKRGGLAASRHRVAKEHSIGWRQLCGSGVRRRVRAHSAITGPIRAGAVGLACRMDRIPKFHAGWNARPTTIPLD